VCSVGSRIHQQLRLDVQQRTSICVSVPVRDSMSFLFKLVPKEERAILKDIGKAFLLLILLSAILLAVSH
jgi:hypothetical protein